MHFLPNALVTLSFLAATNAWGEFKHERPSFPHNRWKGDRGNCSPDDYNMCTQYVKDHGYKVRFAFLSRR